LIPEDAEKYVQHREKYCPTKWSFWINEPSNNRSGGESDQSV
jgi:hypothetical protein